MCGKLLALILLGICMSINGQYDDERDLPPAPYHSDRSAKVSFDSQFSRGRCPERFIQSGQECLYFSPDGKIYSWSQAERICSLRVARMLHKHVQSDMSQPNMTPTKGVRQLVLNTPEKTEIFRALVQEYNEQSYAVRLPADYETLQRCRDGKDDKWPVFCPTNTPSVNTSCLETAASGPTDICLRPVNCNERYLRVACEFTLPGSSELTSSKFRTCVRGRRFFRRLPLWAWILIAVGIGLILIGAVVAIVLSLLKSKKNKSSTKRALPEPRETVTRGTTKSVDPANQPMLPRPGANVSSSDYLQPRPSGSDSNANA